MQTAHELFLHELSDMLDGERKILEALQQQAEESDRSDLQKAFQQHFKQTEKQIERLLQCFEVLEEAEQPAECAGIKGLIEEKKSFEEEDPSEELIDMFNIGAACKVEHYEIAAYTALIDMCQKMRFTKAKQLLQQNLREEQQMLKRCEGFQKKFKPSKLAEEFEEEEERPRTHHKRAA